MLRHLRRLPKGGEHAWLKAWDEEVIPARILCEHRSLYDAVIRLAPRYQPGIDVLLKSRTHSESLEITIAHAARHENWNSAGRTSPGAQDALRSELLNQTGWVSSADPLTRNPKTGKVEYECEEPARDVESAIPEWANGLTYALKKKQRAENYGSGAVLAVYGYGLSGDFDPPRRVVSFDKILKQIPESVLTNGFDRTFIFSWHEGCVASSRSLLACFQMRSPLRY